MHESETVYVVCVSSNKRNRALFFFFLSLHELRKPFVMEETSKIKDLQFYWVCWVFLAAQSCLHIPSATESLLFKVFPVKRLTSGLRVSVWEGKHGFLMPLVIGRFTWLHFMQLKSWFIFLYRNQPWIAFRMKLVGCVNHNRMHKKGSRTKTNPKNKNAATTLPPPVSRRVCELDRD